VTTSFVRKFLLSTSLNHQVTMFGAFDSEGEWPPDAEEMYERMEELGRGSFGVVWMARRIVPPEDEYDDEWVALKNIEIKSEKSYIYASREISILRELRHPCVIRLIRAFPIWKESSQLVVLQLARGPDLQYLVSNKGALGLPLARLVSRHLVAAVSYLHGRAVLHRDIKPTNCILCLSDTSVRHDNRYDWLGDDLIWSDGPDAETAVASNKWKLMLVDFGFARALEESELEPQKKHGRHSIVNESMCMADVANIAAHELEDEKEIEKCAAALRNDVEKVAAAKGKKRLSMVSVNLQELDEVLADASSDTSEPESSPHLVTPERTTKANATNAIPTPKATPKGSKAPQNGGTPQAGALRAEMGRQSSARTKIRGMSALGTKAYAAPEIKHDLRNKTDRDINMEREALTECVADYGMIADAVSIDRLV